MRLANDWARAVDQEGFEALKDKRRSGRKPRLTAGQRQELRGALQAPPPEKKRRDGITLSACIKERFGMDYSVRSCQMLFHKLRRRAFARKLIMSKGHGNTPARDEFKKKAEIEEDGSLIPVCEDEVRFQIQATVTAGWFLRGGKPKAKPFAQELQSVMHWLCNAGNRRVVCGKG